MIGNVPDTTFVARSVLLLENAGAAAVPVSTVELPPDTYVTLQGAEFV
jgi:hypothetical protein